MFDSPQSTPRGGSGTDAPTVTTVNKRTTNFLDQVEGSSDESKSGDKKTGNENNNDAVKRKEQDAILAIIDASMTEGKAKQAPVPSLPSALLPLPLSTRSALPLPSQSTPPPPADIPPPPTSQQEGAKKQAASLSPVSPATSQMTAPVKTKDASSGDTKKKRKSAELSGSSKEGSTPANAKAGGANPDTLPPSSAAKQGGAVASASGASQAKPKPDAFTPISASPNSPPSSGKGDAKGRKGGHPGTSDIDGSQPSTAPSPKASPRGKRRSTGKPELTQEPALKSRYLPDTGKPGTGPIAAATREQCDALLNLLETHADANLRASVLDAIAAMAFRLPERERSAVLQRAWQQARLLQDSALRQWAGLAFKGYCEARGKKASEGGKASARSFLEAAKRFNLDLGSVSIAVQGKEWNRLADALREMDDDSCLQLACAAQALGMVNELSGDDAERALAALANALGNERMVLAFFQSSACPGGNVLKHATGHTAAAVLHGLLRGDAQSLRGFVELLNRGSVSTELAQALYPCAKGLVKSEPRQYGTPGMDKASTATASTTTTTTTTTTATTTTATTADTSSGRTMPGRNGLAVEDTLFDIVLELLLLEADRRATETASLSDRAVCLLLGLLTLDREAALRAIAAVSYDNVSMFVHGVCAEVLAPLACAALMQQPAADGVPLLHDIMANGDVRVAFRYLEKLHRSDMRKQPFSTDPLDIANKSTLLGLLEARDKDGRTALEAAIAKEREQNVREYLTFMRGLTEFNPVQMQQLLEAKGAAAKPAAAEPALVNVIKEASQKDGNGLHAYLKSLFGQDAVDKRDVLALLCAPDADGNTPLRLAMMKNNGAAISGMVKAIVETDKLDAKEKTALLCGLAPGGGDFREKALDLYYQAVCDAYKKRFPGKPIPRPEAVPNRMVGLCSLIHSKVYDGPNGEAMQQREESQHAMLSRFVPSEREKLKAEGRRLYAQERAKALPVFHVALREGKTNAVRAFIEAVLAHASASKDVDVVDLLLAKDAAGNPALFNATGLDRADAVSAYVGAVLSSDQKFVAKRPLLRAESPEGMTALHHAFVTGNLSAMLAYVDAVLGSMAEHATKQDMLAGRNTKGKSARATALTCRDKATLHENPSVKPAVYEMLVERFDAKVMASDLPDSVKKFLTETYNDSSSPKKT
jgi:hypothetical protein